ncbi:MAG: intracellular sulfur oxidation DsrE/DsrF family protein [Gammaproteobacteria bacterium]
MQKIIRLKKTLIALFILMISATSSAQLSSFKEGPLITDFGKNATVSTHTVSKSAKFKVAFDIGSPADAGEVNRKFDSLARFINMHVGAGVDKENIQLALVVHGKASVDLLDHTTYQKRHKLDNPNKALLQALMNNNVRVILCGQTAAAYEIDIKQLVEGVEIELSAMTAHALLQQDGYTINPF